MASRSSSRFAAYSVAFSVFSILKEVNKQFLARPLEEAGKDVGITAKEAVEIDRDDVASFHI